MKCKICGKGIFATKEPFEYASIWEERLCANCVIWGEGLHNYNPCLSYGADYGCTRRKGHPGFHIGGTGNATFAYEGIWNDKGEVRNG